LEFDIIDIRRFEVKDFSDLLEAESQAWYNKLHWDFAPSVRIINSCLREKRLSGYALQCEGQIRGYCFFFYDGEKGLIGDLFVDPAMAGRGHEQRLLDHVVETLEGTPGLRRIEAQLPHFDQEELEPTFLPHRFQSYPRRFMRLPLHEWSPLPTNPEGRPTTPAFDKPSMAGNIHLIPWERSLDEEAAELLYESYRRHVDAAINDQYASVTGATRLIENIVRHQGCGEFLPKISRMAVHHPSELLAGIITVTGIRRSTAHIPQVAVAGTFQGQGVGSALMEAAFRDLTRARYEEVTLTVSDANAGALRLYQSVGFETFKTFGAFIYDRGDTS
jgi:ribosomal protein S18 acetylase RimI-like enzyme